jgi:hypothetical protein
LHDLFYYQHKFSLNLGKHEDSNKNYTDKSFLPLKPMANVVKLFKCHYYTIIVTTVKLIKNKIWKNVL